MKRVITILLAVTMLLSLAACDGNVEVTFDNEAEITADSTEKASRNNKINSEHVVSKGLFVLEPNEKFDLTYEAGLTEQQTYMIYVYDLIPDDTKNIDLNSFESDYTITLNDTNTYESLPYEEDDRPSLNSFLIACGYVTPTEIETILAGGEPIRAISVFKINKNDINENTTVEFTISNNDIYDCVQTFESEDIITIDYFDDIFQIEGNPDDYQIASSLYVRAKCVKQLVDAQNDFQFTPNDFGDTTQMQSLMKVPMHANFNASRDTYSDFLNLRMEEASGSGVLPDYDIEAVTRIYPELALYIDWLDAYTSGAMTTVIDIDSALTHIIEFFENKEPIM